MATAPDNSNSRRILTLIVTILAAIGGYLLTRYLLSR